MPDSKFTPKLQKVVLDRLLSGEALNAICSDKKIDVSESYVRKVARDDAKFGAKYARARDIGYDCRAERAVEDAKASTAGENPQAARLAFDAERWYLGKMKPKLYGDKTLIGSDPDNPLPPGFQVMLTKTNDKPEAS